MSRILGPDGKPLNPNPLTPLAWPGLNRVLKPRSDFVQQLMIAELRKSCGVESEGTIVFRRCC
jgi:hypothetical protein